jgi:heavy metal translocating P-type ATPase
MRTAEQKGGEPDDASNCGVGISCVEPDRGISRAWLRVGVAAVFAGQSMVLSLALNMTPPVFGSPVYWVLHGGLIASALLVLCFLGGSLMSSTLAMLRRRRLSIDGLFMLSLGGAFLGSLLSTLTGEGAIFYEVVSVVIMIHALGRVFGERSLSRLRAATENLSETFEQARVLREGRWSMDTVASLALEDSVRVEAGEAVAVDGLILEGRGYVNESALSGEPLPVVRREGDRVRAGTYSLDGIFVVKVERVLGERELDGILAAVRRREGRPSMLQTQADRLVQFFLPLVAGVSVLTATYWMWVGDWAGAVFNAMAVLLVACPCALGLATPVAIWQGLYRLSQSGLASRDGALIDTLAQTRRIFFDKTGTLSEASLQVTECCVMEGWRERSGELRAAVGALESKAGHPVARSLVRYCGRGEAGAAVRELKDYPGMGMGGRFKDLDLRVGEADLAPEADLAEGLALLREPGGKRVFVFVGMQLAAIFVLREHLRKGVDSSWEELASLGIAAEILTGDPQAELELPNTVVLRSGLRAEEKTERVVESKAAGECPLFVGDGINDSAAMVEATASIAMGSGAELARSSAAALLVGDQIAFLPEAIRFARAVQHRLRSNLIYAALYNTLGMSLAATGKLHPVAAACIMFLSSAWVLSRAGLAKGYKVN